MSRSPREGPDAMDVDAGGIVVIIVNFRTPDLTLRCLASLRSEKERLSRLKVVVVDGGSGDDSAAKLRKGIEGDEYRDWVSLLPLDVNGGFGWANNQALLGLAREENPPEFVHLLNPDTEVQEGAVINLARELQTHPTCAVAGSQLFGEDGDRTASAFRFPNLGRELVTAAQSSKLGDILGVTPTVIDGGGAKADWVTGASFMLRTKALRDAGLFDDGFFLYFEEVELMHRLQTHGWDVRHVGESRVFHLEGASTGLGGSSVHARLPHYWHESRRRYYALTGGKPALLMANLGWLIGRMVWLFKGLLGKSRADGVRMFDLLRHGGWVRAKDQVPSIAMWGETPGRSPAWMVRR